MIARTVSYDRPGSFAVVGELTPSGGTRPIKGVLAMALHAAVEKRTGLLVPSAKAQEAAVVEGLNIYPIGGLAEAVGFLSGQMEMDPDRSTSMKSSSGFPTLRMTLSMSKAKTTRSARLLIAAAGSHKVLMIGPVCAG